MTPAERLAAIRDARAALDRELALTVPDIDKLDRLHADLDMLSEPTWPDPPADPQHI